MQPKRRFPLYWGVDNVQYEALRSAESLLLAGEFMLQNTFCHIPGIGLKTEQDLWTRHIYSWDDVINGAEVIVRGRNKQFILNYIYDSLERLQLRDADYFAKGLPSAESWRLYGEFKHATAFLDIETASGGGLGNYITTIALYDGSSVHYYVHGHNLGKFVEDIERYRVIVTFNGKSFDIPYIANRLLYFFDENPMISCNDVPYENANSKYHHIDLYHNCRRKYKGLFNNYTLTNIERKLLEMKRENELPSSLVGFCYQLYLEDPQKNVGLIREVINHNYWDIYSLPLILNRLLA